jgi:hypothetical protein
MALRPFFSRLFRPKRIATAVPLEVIQRDYSLRPNPDTYLDQNDESATVLNRIRNSSSSVIGIAGVRGAGKSSLAFKLLAECTKSGYFTLLIHSPTGYESREFLLSVFQRICEATITRLEQLFGQEQTVEGRGRAQLRRSRITAILLLIGAFAIFILPSGYAYYRYVKFREARLAALRQNIETQKQKDEAQKQQLITDIQNRFTIADKGQALLEKCIRPQNCRKPNGQTPVLSKDRIEFLNELVRLAPVTSNVLALAELRVVLRSELRLSQFRQYHHPSSQSDVRMREILDELRSVHMKAEQLLLSEDDVRFIATRLDRYDLEDLSRQIQDCGERLKSEFSELQKIETVDEQVEYPSESYLWQALPILALGIIGYGSSIIVVLAGRKVRERMRLQKKYPRETGLYELAREILEHLKYQTTVTSSQDASVSVWKLATKFIRTKQLETRPVSMPGLTADCNSFIENVSEVFGGKSVICLDELDKISDPNQLAELLTGVKGILGQNKSHFILTVSEDALARFATRRRAERDIIESSFDEIISLNRVNFRVAHHIVSKMLVLSERDAAPDRLNKNILVAWIFGSGIPREIKRNVVMAADGFDFAKDDPKDLWRILFTSLVESLKSWALIASQDEDISYNFLLCLEKIGAIRKGSPIGDNPTVWFKDLVALWSAHYELAFIHSTSEHETGHTNEDRDEPFERGIFELMIGAYALLLVRDEKIAVDAFPTDNLLNVFTLLAYSPSFAGFKFRSLLTDAGVFDPPASNA